MTMHVKDAGVWKQVNELSVKDGGVWKTVLEGHVKDGGVWKQFFSSGVVTVTGEAIASSGSGIVVAKLFINPDGTLDKEENGVRTQIDALTDWIIPNSAANPSYEVRYTNFAGDPLAGVTNLTADVWVSINQEYQIAMRRDGTDGNGQSSATFDLEIRLGSSGGALDSGPFSLLADRS